MNCPSATISTSSTRGWVHFGIAAALLTISAAGFRSAVEHFKLVLTKESVPWPGQVAVDAKTFRWINMPEDIAGRFMLVKDGELAATDGELPIPDDTMDQLGIGTGYDKTRVADRKSNWCSVRLYRDSQSPSQVWQVETYYYTGGMDTVPHVPERCMQAGGARLISNNDVAFDVAGLPQPWQRQVHVRRAHFEVPGPDGFSFFPVVEYYLFSLNGRPETSWEKVRLGLTNPFARHVYFAKVQFLYRGRQYLEAHQQDQAAEEFARAVLPVILKALPTAADVDALESDKLSTGPAGPGPSSGS